MILPTWFEKAVKDVDPTYRVEIEDNLVCIIKDVDVTLPAGGGRTAHVRGPRTIDVFEYANDAAIESLRRKKYMGRRMNIVENPMNELRYLKSLDDEAKKKRVELGTDMIAEGLMGMHKFEHSKTFVMPGERKDGKQHNDQS